MRGGKFIFLIIVVILIISGCQGNRVESNVGGVDGRFVENMPPLDGIRDGSDFSVGLMFTNSLLNGVNVNLCIYDTPPESMGGIQGKECKEFFIDAAVRDDNGKITPSRSEAIYFPDDGSGYVYRGVDLGVDKTTIIAEYKYMVDARYKVGEVCMKKKPYLETDYRCESKETFSGSDIEGDVAPVVVEKIEKDIVPEGNNNRIILDIYLRKASLGDVVLEDEDKNLLNLNIMMGGTDGLFVCDGRTDGKVEMKDLTKKVRCEAVVNLGGQEYYTDSINVELNYFYRVVLSTNQIKLIRSREGLS